MLNVNQPTLHTSDVSPKASLAWQPADAWTLTASYGEAFRMPTVTELYQAITTGTQLTVPNPNLKPERADSYELAAEYKTDVTRLRLVTFPRRTSPMRCCRNPHRCCRARRRFSAMFRMWTAPGRKAWSWWASRKMR